MGELLFYVAVRQQQQQEAREKRLQLNGGGESKEGGEEGVGGNGDGGSASSHNSAPDDEQWADEWLLPSCVSDAILHAIGKASDDSVSAHYAAKTLENIFSAALGARPNSVPEALGTPECLSSLLKLSASSATQASAYYRRGGRLHLLRIQPSLQSYRAQAEHSTWWCVTGIHGLVQPLTTVIAAALLHHRHAKRS